jgi:hypothetical protein
MLNLRLAQAILTTGACTSKRVIGGAKRSTIHCQSTIRSAAIKIVSSWAGPCGAQCRIAKAKGEGYPDGRIYRPELSSSSIHALTLSPRAMRAMLSIETFRSDRSTPLR